MHSYGVVPKFSEHSFTRPIRLPLRVHETHIRRFGDRWRGVIGYSLPAARPL